MNLSDEQLERYARHIVLREIGGEGQKRLLAGRVVVIGAGGIGSPAIQYLAAAGVGRLTIVDDDRVSLSNLQRQTLFRTDEVGQSKANIATKVVNALNPDVAVDSRAERIDGSNVAKLLAGAEVVLDGSDNFATRLAVADAALRLRIPLVSAAIGQFQAQVATFRGWEAGKPCYRCFVGDAFDADDCDNCSELGVLGAMAGMAGSLAALEAIRAITPFGEDSAGRLLIVDALNLRFRTVKLPKDPACPSCGAPMRAAAAG